MKIWSIAWKDLLIRFRDRNALLIMLVAPLVLSAIMGAVFGGGTPTPQIKLLVVNHDPGQLSQDLIEQLTANDELFQIRYGQDEADAQTTVATGQASAALVIPADFSTKIIAGTTSIQLYTDAGANLQAQIAQVALNRVLAEVGNQAIAQRIVAQAAREQSVSPAQITPVLEQFHTPIAGQLTLAPSTDNSNLMAFFAPSMALFFLTFTMFDGPRSILTERNQGTLSRLYTTSVGIYQVLLGKLVGTILMGLVQFALLILASQLLFGLQWGHAPLTLVALALSFVLAATGVGILITALAADITQATMIGSAIALISGFLGGNFFTLGQFSPLLQFASYLTINRWGIDGFKKLVIQGQGLNEVLPNIMTLGAIAVVCFVIAGVLLPRKMRVAA